jgi:hypothetical protein
VLISSKRAFAGTHERARGGRLLRSHDTHAVEVVAHRVSGLKLQRKKAASDCGLLPPPVDSHPIPDRRRSIGRDDAGRGVRSYSLRTAPPHGHDNEG